jgi:serine/threonine protein kinase/tetratricopeptide (TPR) repeat protein
MIGQTLGHYRVISKIGAGGMGVVYRAHDEQLDRDVALKVLLPNTLLDEVARRRFRKEALALAKLNHPNVETVFEFSSYQGVDVLAMELIPGHPLSDRIKGGPLSEKAVLSFGIQLAEGLAAAHDQGIIHRDLKPANVFVTPDERIKVVDFGLAKLIDPKRDVDITLSITGETGAISGTVPYMSPEQLRGLPVDFRSDIYAAGTVLYELATGGRPFPQSQSAELVGAILHKSPNLPSSLNPGISPGLDSVISKALEKDPGQRYQSARELRIALESISGFGSRRVLSAAARTESGDSSLAATSAGSRRYLYAGGAALAAVLIVGVVIGLKVPGARNRLFSRSTSVAPGSAAVTSPIQARRSVAVLGFKNVSGKSDKAWLSTALSEMLTTELAAGEQLRTVPGENVAQMKVNLSLPDADSYGQKTLEKINKNLNVDDVVVGSYVLLGNGEIRLDMRLQDAKRGESLAALSEKGNEGQIDEMVSRAGVELREKLGVRGVTEDEAAAVKATLPSNPDAARLYSDGLSKLRLFEALASRELFERAVAAEPNFSLAHSALGSAWSALGYDNNAQLEGKKAFELSTSLPREQRLWVEGRYRESTYDWPKAVDVYKTLRDFFPDNLDYGLQLAVAQTAASQGKAALATIAELRKLPAPARDDPRIDLAEATAAITLGDFSHSLEPARLAASKGEEEGARLLVARARLAEGSALQELGDLKGSAQAAEEAKQVFAAAGDQGGVASALIHLGSSRYRAGDTAGAKQAWEQSLSISRDIGYQQDIESSLNDLANVQWRAGDLAGAKKLFDQSLVVANKTGNARAAAQASVNLAGLLYDGGDFPAAQQAQEKALETFRRIGDKSGTASTLSNLGMIVEARGDFAGARTDYEEALSAFTELGQKFGMASAENKLANLLYEQSHYPEAKTMYERALATFNEVGAKNGILLAEGNLGNIQSTLGDLTQARKMYEEALALARESQENNQIAQSLQSIGGVLEAQGDLEGARNYFEQALAARKALGDADGIVGPELALATLSIEQGHPAAAESAARQAAERFRKEKSPDDEANALAVLARSLFEQAKTHEAETAIDRAAQLAAKSQDNDFRGPIDIMAARIHGASGKTDVSIKGLESILAQQTQLGDVPLQFEARLALGEIEVKSGDFASGRSRLTALENDANAKGFVLTARKAHAALQN